MHLSRDDKGRPLSEQQAAFFQDSKIRDEHGNMLTMYHGSSYDFDAFDPAHIRSIESDAPYNGFWFSDDPYTLPAWTRLKRRFEVYLDLRNPAPMDVVRKVNKALCAEWKSMNEGAWHKESRSTCDELRLRLRDMGYDGIIHDWKPEVDREKLERTGRVVVTSTRGTRYLLEKNREENCLDLFYYEPDTEDYRDEYLTSYVDLDDYLRLQERVVVVFEPQQIKAVTNRTPTMDENFKHNESKEAPSMNGYTDYPYDYGNGYKIQTVFANELEDGGYGDIYDFRSDVEKEHPGAKVLVGYCVIGDACGLVPDGCADWHDTVEEAMRDYDANVLPHLEEEEQQESWEEENVVSQEVDFSSVRHRLLDSLGNPLKAYEIDIYDKGSDGVWRKTESDTTLSGNYFVLEDEDHHKFVYFRCNDSLIPLNMNQSDLSCGRCYQVGKEIPVLHKVTGNQLLCSHQTKYGKEYQLRMQTYSDAPPFFTFCDPSGQFRVNHGSHSLPDLLQNIRKDFRGDIVLLSRLDSDPAIKAALSDFRQPAPLDHVIASANVRAAQSGEQPQKFTQQVEHTH